MLDDGNYHEIEASTLGLMLITSLRAAFLCHPVNVGIKYQSEVECKNDERMGCYRGEIVNRESKEPSLKLVAEWLVEVYMSILGKAGRNAWMKQGFNGFKI